MKKILALVLLLNAVLVVERFWQAFSPMAQAQQATEVILDNGQPGTTASGNWRVSSASGFYGVDSLYSTQAGASYTYSVPLPASGEYDVFLWWTQSSKRRPDVPVDVTHAGGTATVRINQQTGGGRWNLIGRWSFTSSGSVRIRSLGGDVVPNQTSADAVRFVLRSESPPGTTLTPEQAEILSHMSIVSLPTDDDGHTAKAIRISGVNVQIVNGLGATNGYPTDPFSVEPYNTATNGLGNLVIGYTRMSSPHIATGSHNVIVGFNHTHSSFGGLSAGSGNTISGPYACVAGGTGNLASGVSSSVSGGAGNIASADRSSVGGGDSNFAAGFASFVGGGVTNRANGNWSTVSGGWDNVAGGIRSAVGGGQQNMAVGTTSSVTGGYLNVASGQRSSVTGGQENRAVGDMSTISGGSLNLATGLYSTVSGGHGNTASAQDSHVP